MIDDNSSTILIIIIIITIIIIKTRVTGQSGRNKIAC